ncbi:hypothetical protein DL95DRAFT_455754 [Leptodontidium sp. 2 PMI_412]|nr:hypothetical protein DL95DRAFT_455754 [Leptodontidium sp. 2 PMI_412]
MSNFSRPKVAFAAGGQGFEDVELGEALAPNYTPDIPTTNPLPHEQDKPDNLYNTYNVPHLTAHMTTNFSNPYRPNGGAFTDMELGDFTDIKLGNPTERRMGGLPAEEEEVPEPAAVVEVEALPPKPNQFPRQPEQQKNVARRNCLDLMKVFCEKYPNMSIVVFMLLVAFCMTMAILLLTLSMEIFARNNPMTDEMRDGIEHLPGFNKDIY